MKWYALNKQYVKFLKRFDNIVPDVEYTGRLKCFLGIVLKSDNGIDYFAPLTSYKPKFRTLKNNIDFFKLVDDNKKIYGAIGINNMIPVPENEYTEITLENLSEFRDFTNQREKRSYWKLLQKELKLIDEDFIFQSAERLYHLVLTNPNSRIAERCCDFALLEEKCKEYCELSLEINENEEDMELE